MKYQYMALNKKGNLVLLYKSYFDMTSEEVLINLSYEGYNTDELSIIPVNEETQALIENAEDYTIVQL